MRKALFTGTFDPPTLGHLDIIQTASSLFDTLYVGIGENSLKEPLFSIDERIRMLKTMTSHLKNIEVISFKGLAADLALKLKVNAIIRGLRNGSDFDQELIQGEMNAQIAHIPTLYLTSSPEHRYISSTLLKELAKNQAPLSSFVSPALISLIQKKFD